MEVEPSDREHAIELTRETAADCRTSLGIGKCRHHARWLVKRDDAGARLPQPLSVEANVIFRGVRPRPELGDDRAVDADAPPANQRFGRAARGDARFREDLLQTLRGHLAPGRQLSASSPTPEVGAGASSAEERSPAADTSAAARSSASAEAPSSSRVGSEARSLRPNVSRNSGVVP